MTMVFSFYVFIAGIILVFSFAVQIVCWISLIRFQCKPALHADRYSEWPFVSIIIAIRNEYDNLQRHLPKILSQDYPHFEVIVVDDHSTDESFFYLESMLPSHNRLRIFRSPDDKQGKKNALDLGIKEAQGPWLGFIDADCYPNSSIWISEMISCALGGDIVLGYGPYERGSGLLNLLVRYETAFIAAQYLSEATAGRAYMGVGRNLFFKKVLFQDIGGYSSHQDLSTGDDDLFVSEAASLAKVRTCCSSTAFTFSYVAPSWRSWFKQKSRHINSAHRYRTGTKYRLIALHGSHLLFYVSLFMVLLSKGYLFAIICLVLRWFIIWAMAAQFLNRLKEKDLIPYVPICDFLLFIAYSILSIRLVFRSNHPLTWK